MNATSVKASIERWILRPDPEGGLLVLLLHVPPGEGSPEGFWQPITAKLMEENQTLYRLKELEFLERICDKIGGISVMGGGNLLEQLNALLEARKKNG